MGKENVIYILSIYLYIYRYHNGILTSYKKERNAAVWDNMDGLWGHCAKWNKSKTNIVGCHLYMEPEKKKPQKTSEKPRTDWRLPEVGDEGNRWKRSKETNFQFIR